MIMKMNRNENKKEKQMRNGWKWKGILFSKCLIEKHKHIEIALDFVQKQYLVKKTHFTFILA